jgi:NADPH2:quinone reductase
VRAAVITEIGGLPAVVERPDPDGLVLELEATPLNPIDINVGAGRFFGGHPPLPFVPGAEGVGRLPTGERVWAFSDGLGLARDGALAERVSVKREAVVDVPEGVDPALAGALGIAGLAGWMPLSWRAPLQAGETVLVLGATGTVGLVAVQSAKVLGAGRVVAAGRDREGLARAAELGADATVCLDETDDLGAALKEACGGEGPDVVVDPLWGAPFGSVLEAAAPRARIVNVGQSAGPEATLTSNAVRGKSLDILGFIVYAVPRDVLADHYRRLVEHAAAGRITLELERVTLDAVAEAWERQASGSADRKLVVEF